MENKRVKVNGTCCSQLGFPFFCELKWLAQWIVQARVLDFGFETRRDSLLFFESYVVEMKLTPFF